MPKAAALAAAGLLALTAAGASAAPAAPAPPAPPVAPMTHISFGLTFGFHGEIPASLDWRIEPLSRESMTPASSVDFELGYSSFLNSSWWGRAIPATDLAGLSTAQLSGPIAPASFVVHRDAGDFRCHGVAGEGRGEGTCVYAANPGFSAALAKRGVTGPIFGFPQFQLALSDVGFNYLDELKRGGYATPNTDTLVRALDHGVGLRQLTAINATGYRFGDLETLIRLREHGISARYLGDLHVNGYGALKADDLLRLRDQGVSSTYLKDLAQAGYTGLTADEVVKMREHGVSAGFVGAVQAAGYHLAPDDLARLRDHGVSAGFVGELHAMGYDRLNADEIVKLRDHGVSPRFIRTSNQGGAHLTPDDLVRLHETGRLP